MWSGLISAIPTGWSLCDGTDGTPDLRNRFIVGAGDEYDRNDVGGEKSVQLTENELPSHNHTIDPSGSHTHSITDPGHSHSHTRTNFKENVDNGNESDLAGTPTTDSTASSTTGISIDSNNSEHTHIINNTGGDNAHENRPPYFALAYIMKL